MFCLKCQSNQIIKNGIVWGKQRFKCRTCGFQFTPEGSSGHELTDKATALALCHLGISRNQVSKILNTTQTSVTRWINELPLRIPFKFISKNKLEKIEESYLCSYIKKLYIENKENFLIARNIFKSNIEVDLIVKSRKDLKKMKREDIGFFLYGDTLLKGSVFDPFEKDYKVLEHNFVNLAKSTLKLSLINRSQSNIMINTAVRSFSKYSPEVKKCTYVLLSFGNEESNLDWTKLFEQHKKAVPKMSLKMFRSYYIKLIRTIQKRHKTPVLLSLPPINADVIFENACLGRNRTNLLKNLKQINIINQWHHIYNLEIFKIARDLDIPIIDITSCFLKKDNYRSFLGSDGIYPNRQGHLLIANEIKKFYKKYFSSKISL